MKLTRRTLALGGFAAAAGSVLLPRIAVAEIDLGDGVLTTVSDGSLVLPPALPDGVPDDELAELATRFGIDPAETESRPLNVTLWRRGDRTVLIDAGSGPGFVPTAGDLVTNLEAAGTSPDEVTDVVFTHGHPDHLWGILDDFDEVPFPNARLYIGSVERDYWVDPATVDSLEEARKMFAVGAARRIEAIADLIETFADGDEVVPGLTAVATFGHTPGHMSFRAEGSGGRAFVLGDAVTNPHLDFARPGWPSPADQDRDMGAATRAALIPMLAESGEIVIGYHLPEGGIGRVEAEDDGFGFRPAL